jgi:hypothetical protein
MRFLFLLNLVVCSLFLGCGGIAISGGEFDSTVESSPPIPIFDPKHPTDICSSDFKLGLYIPMGTLDVDMGTVVVPSTILDQDIQIDTISWPLTVQNQGGATPGALNNLRLQANGTPYGEVREPDVGNAVLPQFLVWKSPTTIKNAPLVIARGTRVSIKLLANTGDWSILQGMNGYTSSAISFNGGGATVRITYHDLKSGMSGAYDLATAGKTYNLFRSIVTSVGAASVVPNVGTRVIGRGVMVSSYSFCTSSPGFSMNAPTFKWLITGVTATAKSVPMVIHVSDTPGVLGDLVAVEDAPIHGSGSLYYGTFSPTLVSVGRPAAAGVEFANGKPIILTVGFDTGMAFTPEGEVGAMSLGTELKDWQGNDGTQPFPADTSSFSLPIPGNIITSSY